MKESKSIQRGSHFSIAEEVKNICLELVAECSEITRKKILEKARNRRIIEGSIQPADYCDNMATGKWSSHKFLHWESRGRYTLIVKK